MTELLQCIVNRLEGLRNVLVQVLLGGLVRHLAKRNPSGTYWNQRDTAVKFAAVITLRLRLRPLRL